MAPVVRTSLLLPHRWLRTRDLLRELIGRDIKLRYRGSVLGILWTMLNPLAELLVLLFVFGVVLRVDIKNFSSYLFIGLIVYGWFQNSLNFATTAIAGNRELVRRPGVPTAILPIVTVASNMVHFVLSLPILFGLLIASRVEFTAAVAMLPSLIVLEFVLILAFAYPVAIVHVWFRDTQHLLRIALQLLFYLTPIFYEARTVPPSLKWIYQINPMSHLVDAYRAVLMRGEAPHAAGLGYVAALAALFLILGLAWFRSAKHRFVDEL